MTTYAYFKSNIVPLSEAKVGVMTHAFNYGTGCFEGIRGYWNESRGQLYIFRLKEHFERLARSARILGFKQLMSTEELCELTLELIRKNETRSDVYIRPLLYKSSEIVGVRMHDLEDDLTIFTTSMGKYIDAEAGARCGVSSWRRVDDNAIPARAKITGSYINSALAKTEAHYNGFDEAIMLTHEGHVSEGSGENLFLVSEKLGSSGNDLSDFDLVTPAPSDNILLGITRATVIQLAQGELGIGTLERSIDKSELYTASECFMTGTAAEITPVVEIDRRAIGRGDSIGKIGPVTLALQKIFFDAVKGNNDKYISWCTPVYK